MKNIAATFLALTYLLASVGCQSEFAPPISKPINGNKNIEDSADGKDAAYCSKCGANLLAGEHIEKVQGV